MGAREVLIHYDGQKKTTKHWVSVDRITKVLSTSTTNKPKGKKRSPFIGASATQDESQDSAGTSKRKKAGPSPSINEQDFLDQHNDLCEVCSAPGDVLCCATCNLVFHMRCVLPKLYKEPSDDWRCAYCIADEVGGDEKVKSRALQACKDMEKMRGIGIVHSEKAKKKSPLVIGVESDKDVNISKKTEHRSVTTTSVKSGLQDCPELLGPGWKVEMVPRKNGSAIDKYYYSSTGERFRSLVQARASMDKRTAPEQFVPRPSEMSIEKKKKKREGGRSKRLAAEVVEAVEMPTCSSSTIDPSTLQVGSRIEVDYKGTLFNATLLKHREKMGAREVLIHYDGQKKTIKYWVSVDNITKVLSASTTNKPKSKKRSLFVGASTTQDESQDSAGTSKRKNIGASPKIALNEQDFLDQHNDLCEVCSAPGDVLCCATCNLVFHMRCVLPKLYKEPSDDWRCAYCIADEVGGDEKVKSRALQACKDMEKMREIGIVHSKKARKQSPSNTKTGEISRSTNSPASTANANSLNRSQEPSSRPVRARTKLEQSVARPSNSGVGEQSVGITLPTICPEVAELKILPKKDRLKKESGHPLCKVEGCTKVGQGSMRDDMCKGHFTLFKKAGRNTKETGEEEDEKDIVGDEDGRGRPKKNPIAERPSFEGQCLGRPRSQQATEFRDRLDMAKADSLDRAQKPSSRTVARPSKSGVGVQEGDEEFVAGTSAAAASSGKRKSSRKKTRLRSSKLAPLSKEAIKKDISEMEMSTFATPVSSLRNNLCIYGTMSNFSPDASHHRRRGYRKVIIRSSS